MCADARVGLLVVESGGLFAQDYKIVRRIANPPYITRPQDGDRERYDHI